MREILMINPRGRSRRRKQNPSSKGKTKGIEMARRKRRAGGGRKRRTSPIRYRRAATTTRKRARRSYRRNPESETYEGNPRRRYKRTRAVAGRLFGGLNFKQGLKDALILGFGMFGAKFLAKRFSGGASEADPSTWTIRTYLQMGGGAILAAMAANLLRPGMGQKVMEGGFALLLFKLIQNKLIQQNATATSWLGAAEVEPGSGLLLDLDGSPYMLGPAGEELPLDESHRMSEGYEGFGEEESWADGYGEEESWGESLVEPGPLGRFGETLVPVSQLGFGQDRAGAIAAYRRDWV